MKKLVKKYGGSLIITLDKETVKIYGFKEGDLVDVEITKMKGGRRK